MNFGPQSVWQYSVCEAADRTWLVLGWHGELRIWIVWSLGERIASNVSGR